MSRLLDIPIRVEQPVRTGGLGGGVAAILSELVGMLEILAGGGPPATIDMRSLPMSPQDRIELQSVLGNGEIVATLAADGLSAFRETRVSGVWWVEHRDRHGELIAELLDVARFPPILQSDLGEIRASALQLRERIAVGDTGPPAGVHS